MIGCSIHQLVEAVDDDRARSPALGGLEDRAQLALEAAQRRSRRGRCTWRAATPRSREVASRSSTSGSSVLSRRADASAYRMKSTWPLYGRGGDRGVDRRDPVDREGAGVVAAVVVRGQPAALDRRRVDDAARAGAVVVDVADQHRRRRPRSPRAARPASRSAASVATRCGGPARGRPVAGPDRGDDLRRRVRLRAGRRGAARARRSRGRAGPQQVGRATRTVPSAASTTGAAPSSRSRGSSTSSGTSTISTVGAIRRSPRVPAFGWCSSSVSAVSSSARRNASAWPTRTVPKVRAVSSTR